MCVLARSVYQRDVCIKEMCVLVRSVYQRDVCIKEMCVLARSVYQRDVYINDVFVLGRLTVLRRILCLSYKSGVLVWNFNFKRNIAVKLLHLCWFKSLIIELSYGG